MGIFLGAVFAIVAAVLAIGVNDTFRRVHSTPNEIVITVKCPTRHKSLCDEMVKAAVEHARRRDEL